jgi:hypothetical protein
MRGSSWPRAIATVLWLGLALTACGHQQPRLVAPTAPLPTPTRVVVTPSFPLPRVLPTPVIAPTVVATPTPYVCPTVPGGRSGPPLQSPELSCEQGERLSVASEPIYLTVEVRDGVPVVEWQSGAGDRGHYDIYRAAGVDGTWERRASVLAVSSVESKGWYLWRDPTAQAGQTYRYGVVTINYWGKTSPLQASPPLTLP